MSLLTSSPTRFSGNTRRPQSGFDCLVDSVELMITRNLLCDLFPVILKDDEIANQIKQPGFIKHALEHRFQLQRTGWNQLLSRDGAPCHETLPNLT